MRGILVTPENARRSGMFGPAQIRDKRPFRKHPPRAQAGIGVR